jgi:UDP-GlcNAc3NAcA epimerase
MKIVTILGARPQFIKATGVSRAFSRSRDVQEIIIHTGQHFDPNMSDIFFSELELKTPDYHLGIHGLDHGAMTGRMMERIETLLKETKPSVVMVYGDTDSTLAGALAAAKLNIPVAHVEAGLRSYNKLMPEETNRVLTDHLADFLFTPTEAAVNNLQEEGISKNKIYPVGDVMYDATLYYSKMAHEKSTILRDIKLEPKKFYLATIHRPQNADTPEALRLICQVLDKVAEKTRVIFPIHPRTRKMMNEFKIELKNAEYIDPVGYLDMIELESQSALMITDSGGVQKEAYFHRVPCVTLRLETEWVELVENQWNLLLPLSDVTEMVSEIHRQAGTIGKDVQLYGSGEASVRIAETLLNWNQNMVK